MAYEIRYTDEINKGVIVVEDREVNGDDTSLSFPGRGVTNYGKIVAENMLHMLENFAFSIPPSNPVEGQTWYDNTAGVDQLKIYDGTRWVPASGVFKAATTPEVTSALAGDLWVDTDNQQLYLNSGAGWILVGPEFSSGTSTGPRTAILAGTDNINYTVLIFDVNQIPVIILSGNQFVPKSAITGFSEIKPGVNLSTRTLSDGALKYRGVAESAETLRVGNNNIQSVNFLRADINTTANGILSVRNNQGIRVGDNNQLTLQASGEASLIRNNFSGASIDLQVKQGNDYLTALRLRSNPGDTPTVGINTLNPQATLDVTGDVKVSDVLFAESTEQATALNEGALQVSGGASVAKNLQVGENITTGGNITLTGDITGDASNLSNFDVVTANTFIGNVQGSVIGTLQGSASSASRLLSTTSFEIIGDVSAPAVVFNGAGDLTKVFDTTISNDFIANKTPKTTPQQTDEILINRVSGDPGLYKMAQRDLVKNVPTNPVGMIAPFGGTTAPAGWLLCNGAIIPKSDAFDLWQVIGHNFLDPTELQNRGFSPETFFALPDFRGRFPLGLDNMGGASANRVTDLGADILGNSGGTEAVDINKSNLPAHEHDLRSSGENAKQYYAIRDVALDTNNDSPEVTDLSISTGTSAVSGIPTSGSIIGGGETGVGDYRDVAGEDLGAPLGVMNPYTAVNYIIWTGGA